MTRYRRKPTWAVELEKSQPKTVSFIINEDGSLVYLMDESVKSMFEGEGEVRRASHVEPSSPFFRLLFHGLRYVFGDKGRMSDLTRNWPCLWRVNTNPVGGPILNTRYKNRQAAIDAEITFLNNWFLERKI